MDFDAKSETCDPILGGALTIVQPASGYRFSLDSLLLGSFAEARARDRVLELGSGCGVIALMIAGRRNPREIVGLELQSELVALARRNLELNGFPNGRMIEADLRARHIDQVEPASFDYVVANPPYRGLRQGRESPQPGRHLARGSGGATLSEFLASAARYSRSQGRVAMVFTASRLAELNGELRAHGLEPKRLRFVHPYIDRPAGVVLLEARKGGRCETRIAPPLIIWRARGRYSEELEALLAGRADHTHPSTPSATNPVIRSSS
jgi:tRNA1(Val) A37 N6-methylase TrmN6